MELDMYDRVIIFKKYPAIVVGKRYADSDLHWVVEFANEAVTRDGWVRDHAVNPRYVSSGKDRYWYVSKDDMQLIDSQGNPINSQEMYPIFN